MIHTIFRAREKLLSRKRYITYILSVCKKWVFAINSKLALIESIYVTLVWRVEGTMKNKNLVLISHGREKLKKLKLIHDIIRVQKYFSSNWKFCVDRYTARLSPLCSCSKNKENIVSNFGFKNFTENVLEKKESVR